MGYKLVKYKDEKYWIIYRYDSGYCEIKKEASSLASVELVHVSELKEVIEKNRSINRKININVQRKRG
jgi:hypothetical protein